jgi:hypothetical protein
MKLIPQVMPAPVTAIIAHVIVTIAPVIVTTHVPVTATTAMNN